MRFEGVMTLRELCSEIHDCSHSTPTWTDRGVLVLRNQNIRNGRLDLSEPSFTDERNFSQRIQRALPLYEDVVITREAPMGQVCMIPRSLRCCLGQRMVLLRPNRQKVAPRYLLYALQSSTVQNVIRIQGGIGSTVSNLRIPTLAALEIPLPSLGEQEAISDALSDADALIEFQEQLLAKKRQLKQGGMQELLTGKKRLPGFNGEWETKSLGELFNFSGGFTASRDQLSSDGHCYLHYGDIHLSTKSYVDVRSELHELPKLNVPLKRVSSVSMLHDGDIVFVDASEDDEGTSKHLVVINPEGIPFISGLHTIVAKSKTNELVNPYRRYCFQTRAVKSQFRFFSVGTKVSGISKTNIGKIMLPVPTRGEQTAIAAILADMDTEITALEAKLAKARAIKQGMMQELLTGRIRLV